MSLSLEELEKEGSRKWKREGREGERERKLYRHDQCI
jgi:hypothetical protein